MKKVLLFVIFIIIITGCSKTTVVDEKNNVLEIDHFLTSIGNVDATLDQQKLSYEFTISNKEKIVIKKMDIVLTDWINKNKMEDEISELIFNEDNFTVKGYVIFDTKNLTKKEILENEPFIKGYIINTESGEEIFIEA